MKDRDAAPSARAGIGRITACVLVWLFGALTSTAQIAPGDWPGWRGDGSGVTAETNLPVAWGMDRNIAWRTPIPGDGIASPIVLGERVFVSTAIEDSAVLSKPTLFAVLAVLIALAFLAAAARRRRTGEPPRGLAAFVLNVDGFAAWLCFLGFIAGIVAMFTVDTLMIAGNLGRTWRVTGAVGMLGLIAGTGFTSPRSLWRLLGVAALMAAAVLYHQKAPEGYTQPIPFKELILTSGPLAAAALWSLFVMALAGGASERYRGAACFFAAVCAFGAAALLFAYPNFLERQAGLNRVILCLDRDTGKERWRATGFNAPSDKKYHTNSYATPTPVTDGEIVVASFGHGLFATDLDGNVKWRHREPDYARFQRYGAAASPVIVGDRVIYMFMPEWPGKENEGNVLEYEQYGHVTALDKETGKVIWHVKPPRSRDTYATPRIAKVNGRDAVIIVTWERATAFDVRDGQQIWTCEVPIDQCVPTPVLDRDTVYVIGGAHGPTAAVAIRLDGNGNITDSNVRWMYKKSIPQCPSPILYDGLLYIISDPGVLTCLDPKDGAVVYKQRLKNRFQAALVAGEGKVYCTGIDGETIIVKAGRTFEILGRSKIEGEVFSSPVIAHRRFLVRTRTDLYCVAPPQ